MIDSNELTRKIKTPLNPKAALIAYASENEKNFFLEISKVFKVLVSSFVSIIVLKLLC